MGKDFRRQTDGFRFVVSRSAVAQVDPHCCSFLPSVARTHLDSHAGPAQSKRQPALLAGCGLLGSSRRRSFAGSLGRLGGPGTLLPAAKRLIPTVRVFLGRSNSRDRHGSIPLLMIPLLMKRLSAGPHNYSFGDPHPTPLFSADAYQTVGSNDFRTRGQVSRIGTS